MTRRGARTVKQTERPQDLDGARVARDDLPVVARRAEDRAADRGARGVPGRVEEEDEPREAREAVGPIDLRGDGGDEREEAAAEEAVEDREDDLCVYV